MEQQERHREPRWLRARESDPQASVE